MFQPPGNDSKLDQTLGGFAGGGSKKNTSGSNAPKKIRVRLKLRTDPMGILSASGCRVRPLGLPPQKSDGLKLSKSAKCLTIFSSSNYQVPPLSFPFPSSVGRQPFRLSMGIVHPH